MTTPQLRASLRLWRWRRNSWKRKLVKASQHHQVLELHRNIRKADARIARRLEQIQARAPKRDWMPGAHKIAGLTGTAWQSSCRPRGVLHTTEGETDATSTLVGNGDEPHFQVERSGRITQYLPMSVGSKALKHTSDPPTNGAHAYQIEVVGRAAEPDWPAVQVDAVRQVMRFIEHNGGVERDCHVSFERPVRLSGVAWLSLTGWCGHVHVPENDHVDPGAIDIRRLLA